MTDHTETASEILNTILQNSDDGIMWLKALRNDDNAIVDFNFMLANPASLQIIEKNSEEVLGRKMLDLFPENKATGLFDKYVDVVETGKKYFDEFRFAQEGEENWFKILVYKLGDGFVIKFNNISELKKTITANRRSQNLYTTLVKFLPGVEIALIDKSYRVVLVDGNPFKMLDTEDPIREDFNLHQLLIQQNKGELLPLLRSSFKGNSSRQEVEYDGKLYRISCVPIREELDFVSHVLLISEDISIFRYSQNELRNKVYALESANESLEQFAYVASHDLQEPLRKIRAFGDRLSSKYADQLEGSGKDYIERMQNAAARMQTLIDDLLKYSRVGRFREPFQQISLDKLMEDILSDLESALSENKTRVKVEALPTVHGEPSQLRQLFQNLISNAIKFHRPDTPPEITISYETAKLEELLDLDMNETDGTYYKIQVTDNGIGFDEKYLDRIFNIFQRLHGRSEYKGTGIGLAICRKIVENHGGYISAYSTPGQGSTFYVILPEKQTPEQ